MTSWHAVRTGEPQLADAARGLLYQLGVSLAFLAPTRRDGGPRTHPICPLNHVTGRAFARTDPGLHANQALGELFLDTAMRTRTTGHGDPDPRHTICKAATTPDGG